VNGRALEIDGSINGSGGGIFSGNGGGRADVLLL
jgi:hypothetical protein